MSTVSIQNWIGVVTNDKYIIIPTISLFCISDKNTYEPKFMYKDLFDSTVLYIHGSHTYNSPIHYTEGIYMSYPPPFYYILPFYYFLPLFDNNAKE